MLLRILPCIQVDYQFYIIIMYINLILKVYSLSICNAMSDIDLFELHYILLESSYGRESKHIFDPSFLNIFFRSFF